ncbi:MAG: hypothetical protein U0Q15_09715 [Kineosporiaceae bacterium]
MLTLPRTPRSVLARLAAVTLAAAALAVVPGAGPAAAAGCALTGLDTYRWDGEAGNGLWADVRNWDHGGNANDKAPGGRVDTPWDDYACIPAGAAVVLDAGGQGVSADLAALDLDVNATLTLNRGGKIFLHGGPTASIASITRPGSVLTLNAATLGGEATVRVEGRLSWRSTDSGAATMVTRDCDLAGPCASGAAPVPGTTLIAPGGLLVVDGRGVNLEDRRTVDNQGTTLLTGANAYIAADYGTALRTSGTFQIGNDRGYYQGRQRYGITTRSTFTNTGTLLKSAGTGISVIDAAYSSTGTTTVRAGTLSVYGAVDGSSAVTAAKVSPAAAFGTAACAPGATSCTAANLQATAADTQTTQVRLPALGSTVVTVSMQELPAEKVSGMRIAPVEIATPGAVVDAAHTMTFTLVLDATLVRSGETAAGVAASAPVQRKAAGATSYTTVPGCVSGALPAGAASCVDRAASTSATTASATGDVVLIVRTLQNSRWVVR